MTELEVKVAVRAELKEHLLTAWREAPGYVDAYVESALAGRQSRAGSPLHPHLTRLCKDVALDVLAAQRGQIERGS